MKANFHRALTSLSNWLDFLFYLYEQKRGKTLNYLFLSRVTEEITELNLVVLELPLNG